MSEQDLTKLEKAVIDELLTGDHPKLDALRRQVDGCKVTGRETSGSGFFTYLDVDEETRPISLTEDPARISGVGADLPGLSHGAGFVLFIESGYVSMLEGYTYDEPWPETVGDFEIFVKHGDRDSSILGLD